MDRLCFGMIVKFMVKFSLNNYNEKLKNIYLFNLFVFFVVFLKLGVYKIIGRNYLNMYSI